MGLLSSIGKMFNDYSGATASAQQQWKYQKEAMQNAHQWEVEDLKAAGLNPVLSAGGSGASASAPGGGQSAQVAGITDIAKSAVDIWTATKQNELTEAETENRHAMAGNIEAQTQKTLKETGNLGTQNQLLKEQIKTQVETQSKIQKEVEKLETEIERTASETGGTTPAIMKRAIKGLEEIGELIAEQKIKMTPNAKKVQDIFNQKARENQKWYNSKTATAKRKFKSLMGQNWR